MILVDTSAWVEFDRATGSGVDEHLTHLIASTDDVAVTEPVIMEVLAGARTGHRERDLRRLMQRFTLMRFEPTIDFDAATRIYWKCRRSGVTPTGMVDCMIAAVALRHGASILAADAALTRVGEIAGITVESK